MAYLFLLFACLAISTTSASYSHMPLAQCDQQNLTDLPYEDWSSFCPSRCPTTGRRNATMLSVLKLDDDVETKWFLRCVNTETTWKFEETWTFSKLMPVKIRKTVYLAHEELINHISITCPDYDCNQAVSDEISLDYHWASVTTIVKSVISCLTVNAIVVNVDGVYSVKYQGEIIGTLDSTYVRLPDQSILIWNSDKSKPSGCPYISGPLMECYGDTIFNSYYCPGSAIFLENLTYTKISGCDLLIYRSAEGVYVGVNYYEPTSYVHEILLEPSAYVDTWVEALAYDFNGIITGMQQQSCYDKCNLEGIAMSLAKDSGWFFV